MMEMESSSTPGASFTRPRMPRTAPHRRAPFNASLFISRSDQENAGGVALNKTLLPQSEKMHSRKRSRTWMQQFAATRPISEMKAVAVSNLQSMRKALQEKKVASAMKHADKAVALEVAQRELLNQESNVDDSPKLEAITRALFTDEQEEEQEEQEEQEQEQEQEQEEQEQEEEQEEEAMRGYKEREVVAAPSKKVDPVTQRELDEARTQLVAKERQVEELRHALTLKVKLKERDVEIVRLKSEICLLKKRIVMLQAKNTSAGNRIQALNCVFFVQLLLLALYLGVVFTIKQQMSQYESYYN